MALAGFSPGSCCRQRVWPNNHRQQRLPRGGMAAMGQNVAVGGGGAPASRLPLPRAGKRGHGRNRAPLPPTSAALSLPWPR